MTDKSVEDFFAKKDKNKKSKSKANKSKFTTADQIAKKSFSTNTAGGATAADGEKRERKEKKQTQVLPTSTDDTSDDNVTKPANEIPQADDEWKDYEDPSSKDYSGLRIQSLQIGTGADADEQVQEGEEFDENGELLKSDGTSGPWNKQTGSEQPTVDVIEIPKPEPVAPPAAPEPEAPKSNKYVPPAKRAGAVVDLPSSTPSNDRFRRRKKLVAPEITSESDFPSLSASSDIAKYKTKESERDFETVTKGGSRGAEDPAKKGSQIEIQNKYSALQN